jgi:hypothetical protein
LFKNEYKNSSLEEPLLKTEYQEKNYYLIDDLKESTQCRLVTHVLGIPRMLAYGLAMPLIEGALFNGQLIPKGYAMVHLSNVKDGYRSCNVEFPGDKGGYKL